MAYSCYAVKTLPKTVRRSTASGALAPGAAYKTTGKPRASGL